MPNEVTTEATTEAINYIRSIVARSTTEVAIAKLRFHASRSTDAVAEACRAQIRALSSGRA